MKKSVFVAYEDGTIECSMPPRQALVILRSICDDIMTRLVIQEVATAKPKLTAV